MSEVSVTVRFPNEEIAKRWMGWMCDGGGEYEFMEVEDAETGTSISFDYDFNKWFVTVTINKGDDNA